MWKKTATAHPKSEGPMKKKRKIKLEIIQMDIKYNIKWGGIKIWKRMKFNLSMGNLYYHFW